VEHGAGDDHVSELGWKRVRFDAEVFGGKLRRVDCGEGAGGFDGARIGVDGEDFVALF